MVIELYQSKVKVRNEKLKFALRAQIFNNSITWYIDFKVWPVRQTFYDFDPVETTYRIYSCISRPRV